MTQLVWFRNDLRLADNPALTAACQSGEPVRACFVVTPQQWQEHDWSAARVRFVLEHANALARELAELGVPLTFLNAERFSDGSDALLQFCKDSDIADVHFNEEYGINERRRDKALRDRLVDFGIRVSKYRDQTVAPVGQILTQQNEPYSVFTPFSRRWRSWIEETRPTLHPRPAAIGNAVKPEQTDTLPAPFREAPEPLVPTGEDAAHEQLEAFLTERAKDYKDNRDFPALDGTSQLSPYLANGVLSGRQCLIAAKQSAFPGKAWKPGSMKSPGGISTSISFITTRG